MSDPAQRGRRVRVPTIVALGLGLALAAIAGWALLTSFEGMDGASCEPLIQGADNRGGERIIGSGYEACDLDAMDRQLTVFVAGFGMMLCLGLATWLHFRSGPGDDSPPGSAASLHSLSRT